MAPLLTSCFSTLAVTTAAVEDVPFAFRVETKEGVPFGFRINAPTAKKTLLQTWNAALDGTDEKNGAKANPVKRVVKLLNEMKATLNTEMEEDEEMYDKLACWCNDNTYSKGNSVTTSTEKITELENSIESLTAKSAELKTTIKETEDEVAANKNTLATATAQREKEKGEFSGKEKEDMAAIENMKSAIAVLSKHSGSAAFLAQINQQVSFLSMKKKDDPDWESKRLDNKFETFMRQSDFGDDYSDASDKAVDKAAQGFLQTATTTGGPSMSEEKEEVEVVRNAVRVAHAFLQAHNQQQYYPAYESQSGQILGVLKQMQEDMESDLSEAQKTEIMRASAFAELRTAKTSEIENGEKMAEAKEDELAKTDNDLAEAKEDLLAEEEALTEAQKFLKNLKGTCADADKNFNARKQARMEEITAVSETIEILTADDARDAMSGTYNFMQLSSYSADSKRRRLAAGLIRKVAAKTASPELAVLATSVELDSFGRVKKAIDDMIAALKQQQSDEVKKNDWCTDEFRKNDMDMAKAEGERDDLQAKSNELGTTITTLKQGIADAQAAIADLQMNMQRASEDRKVANIDFQTTVADQTMTIEILHKALDKLASFYDKEFLQTSKKSISMIQRGKQTPPVAEAEYQPNAGASGVMSMIEKLIHDAKGLVADAKTSEGESQAAYEALVEDTNANIAALSKEVVAKTKARTKAEKDKLNAESDLTDTVDELEGIHNAETDLHAECDYIQQNFQIRQDARGQEIEALQQAKQLLSGADFS